MLIKKLFSAIAATVAWLIIALLGVLFTAAGLHGVKDASTHYEPVTANVIVSKPNTRRGNINTSSRNRWSSSVDIQYFYEINGTRFNGRDQLAIGNDNSPSEADARVAAAADLYAPGKTVQIFVDPMDPSRSKLKRETGLLGMPVLIMGIIFLVGASGWGLFPFYKLLRRIVVTTIKDNGAERRFNKGMERVLLILLCAMLVSALAWGATEEPVTVATIVGLVILTAGWIVWDKRRTLHRKDGQ